MRTRWQRLGWRRWSSTGRCPSCRCVSNHTTRVHWTSQQPVLTAVCLRKGSPAFWPRSSQPWWRWCRSCGPLLRRCLICQPPFGKLGVGAGSWWGDLLRGQAHGVHLKTIFGQAQNGVVRSAEHVLTVVLAQHPNRVGAGRHRVVASMRGVMRATWPRLHDSRQGAKKNNCEDLHRYRTESRSWTFKQRLLLEIAA